MTSFNKVILVGNLTRDIELRYLQSGMAVADASIAVNDRKKSGEEWVEETSFIDLTIWGKTAELAAEYTSKGSSILVEGRLKQETWENTDGQKRSKIKVVVEKLQFLGRKGDKPVGTPDQSKPTDNADTTESAPTATAPF